MQQIGLADKGGDERIARVLVHRQRRIHLRDAPGFHDDHAVADRHGLGLIVRDHDGGRAHLALDLAQLELHLFTQLGVQVGQRLVQQQHRRLDDQRPCQGNTLALAAGELARVAVDMLVQMYECQRLQGALAAFGRGALAHLQAELHVLAHRHVRE